MNNNNNNNDNINKHAVCLPDQEEVVLVETGRVLAPKLVGLVGGRPGEARRRDLEHVLVERAHVHDERLELLLQVVDVLDDVRVLDLTVVHELHELLHLRLQHAQTVGLDHLRRRRFLQQILRNF